KDTPRDSLLTIMRGFTAALGVQCQYCHVQEPAQGGPPGGGPPGGGPPGGGPPGGGPPGGGPPGAANAPRTQLKPELDDQPQKNTARFMIRMADSLNRVVLAAMPE